MQIPSDLAWLINPKDWRKPPGRSCKTSDISILDEQYPSGVSSSDTYPIFAAIGDHSVQVWLTASIFLTSIWVSSELKEDGLSSYSSIARPWILLEGTIYPTTLDMVDFTRSRKNHSKDKEVFSTDRRYMEENRTYRRDEGDTRLSDSLMISIRSFDEHWLLLPGAKVRREIVEGFKIGIHVKDEDSEGFPRQTSREVRLYATSTVILIGKCEDRVILLYLYPIGFYRPPQACSIISTSERWQMVPSSAHYRRYCSRPGALGVHLGGRQTLWYCVDSNLWPNYQRLCYMKGQKQGLEA